MKNQAYLSLGKGKDGWMAEGIVCDQQLPLESKNSLSFEGSVVWSYLFLSETLTPFSHILLEEAF